MPSYPVFTLPVIDDSDIAWVCDLLGLPAEAFAGTDGTDPRLPVLKSTESIDIEACPGSGKTTLLVAKLAILAKKWTDPRRGICVLSHTNVARREIETQLGNTAAGQRLLSYPHYVGTIHGFVNEFLAIPLLRSQGIPVRAIDDHLCETHRRRLLKTQQFSALANAINPKEAANDRINIVGNWRVATEGFAVLRNGVPEFKDQTKPAAKQLVALARKCAQDGYHCYDEMFMWAHDLLDRYPETVEALRLRFPAVFIDEVQDNSELQSGILHRIFVAGPSGAAIRQRYGDSNQAIYGNANGAGATTDTFPHAAICRAIPNSHRFGQEIASLADPLGLVPHGLIGLGPKNLKVGSDTSGKHTVFLFDDATVNHVIESYARYLREIFTPTELRDGVFTAVAAVHRPGEKDDNIPRHVGKYWPDYDPALTAAEPKPETLQQYFFAGAKSAAERGETHFVTEKIAEGIFRLAQMTDPLTSVAGKRKHRQMAALLVDNQEARALYFLIVTRVAVDRQALIKEFWDGTCKPAFAEIVRCLTGKVPAGTAAEAFLAWDDGPAVIAGAPAIERDNIYRYPAAAPEVSVRVGSIHSVKGETHTATLVLESFRHKHHLASLKPWLTGAKTGQGKEGVENLKRLKQHYVAMTRPTHLLCLALREDAITAAELTLLKARGWRLARVQAGGYEWIE
ncbi:MAG: UvrD-helicase domain-containing protein [Rhizobium sp.]|nr:UvrD-helicase domain-containing protein [Rhizobium sp.]